MPSSIHKSYAVVLTMTMTTFGFAESTFTESFDGNSNVGGWTWGTGNEQFSPINGNPGAYLQDLTLFSCCPAAGTSFNVDSIFTGDYRERNVTSVGIDLVTLDAAFPIGDRPLTVILLNDNDTPFNFDDDWGAYFIGDQQVPDPGVPILVGGSGWTAFDFEIPSQAMKTPDGWIIFDFGGTVQPDWVDVVSDVDVLRFFYGDPTQIFLTMSWDVGMDNPRITEGEPAVPGDLDGDGNVGTSDLLQLLAAWGTCSGCPEDLDGDGSVGTNDLLTLLAAWSS